MRVFTAKLKQLIGTKDHPVSWAPRNLLFEAQRHFLERLFSSQDIRRREVKVEIPDDGGPILLKTDTTEYAVLFRRAGRELIDTDLITTDLEQARRARDAQQIAADYFAGYGDGAPEKCVLVMRTCTPWCEVHEEKQEDKQ